MIQTIFALQNQKNMKKIFPVIILSLFFFTTVSAQQPTKIPHLELPAIKPNDFIVKHLAYTLSFNIKHEQANWVAYELTDSQTRKTVNRSNVFKPDLAIKTGSATNEDYEGSGYDRGHLAPAADMSWSTKSMEESFFYSNMSPQVPGFNRGIWKKLEEQVRQWAKDNQSIYVVTGPILTDNLPTIGPDKVSVPRYYYKVILDYTEPELKGIGFILPNASSTLPLQSFAVTINSVEHLTDINFFPALSYKQEQAIEQTICVPCWTWTTTSSKKNHMMKSNTTTVQCSAITKAGNRCKRMTSNASGICTQHEKQ